METSKGEAADSGPAGPAVDYPHWIARRAPVGPSVALAGRSGELRLERLFPDLDGRHGVRWTVAGQTLTGPAPRWTPRAPGIFTIVATAGGQRRTGGLLVGIAPSDLVKRNQELDYCFCLIARRGLRLHFIPLLERRDGKRAAPERLEREAALHHPAFAQLMSAHSRIYRRKILPRLFVDARRVQPGLYAVFPSDLLYLGSARPIAAAARLIAENLEALATMTTGRGRLLREIEHAVGGLVPLSYRYADEPQFPVSTPQRRGKFSTERFASEVVTDLIAATLAFGEQIGVEIGVGGGTEVISYNAGNGTLSTRLFASDLGLWRQVTSAFDLLRGRPEPGVSLRRAFGPGRSLRGDRSGLNFGTDFGLDHTDPGTGFDPFGRGNTGGDFGGLGGLANSGGLGTLGGGQGQYLMDSDGGTITPGDFPGYDSDGHFWVGGDDGSEVGFRYGDDGSPEASATEVAPHGTVIYYGEVTKWNFEPEDVTGGPGGGDQSGGGIPTVGGEPSGGQGGPDGGTDGDGGSPDGGNGGDAGGDTGGDTGGDSGGDTGGDTGGDAGGDSGGVPQPGGEGVQMPNPDAPDGGNEGVSPVGRSGPTVQAASLGVITRGSGYTDPSPETSPSPGGDESGEVHVRPGGTDPTDESGFGTWGGYNPPIGKEVDPLFGPTPGTYRPVDAVVSARTVSLRDGVRTEELSGMTIAGRSADGIFSAGMIEGPGQSGVADPDDAFGFGGGRI
jgi:hypothetical protein